MAQALSSGLVSAGLISPGSVILSDVNESLRLQAVNKGFKAAVSNKEVSAFSQNVVCHVILQVVAFADIVILAVKPQAVANVLADIEARVAQTSAIALVDFLFDRAFGA